MSGEADGWGAAARERLLAAARLAAGDDVLALGAAAGGGALAFDALERIADGWVLAVEARVDALEELLRAAHARGASGVAYLVGDAAVLPLPDASVDAAVGRAALAEVDAAEAVRELRRVLRPGGRLSLVEPLTDGGPDASALRDAGFAEVAVEPEADGEEPLVRVTAVRA